MSTQSSGETDSHRARAAFFSIYKLCARLAASLKNSPGSLLNLACASRLLSDVALDELWSDLEKFRNLIRLLPRNCYRIKDSYDDDDNSGTVIFTRLLRPSDFTVFNSYAIRVKSLSSAYEELDDIEGLGVVQTPLLPRLQKLQCYVPKSIDTIVSILTPSITHVSIYGSAGLTVNFSIMLQLLPTRLPNLEHLSLNGRALTNHPPISDVVLWLSECANLEHLSFCWGPKLRLSALKPASFPSLNRLTISGVQGPPTDCLLSFTSYQLHTLELNFEAERLRLEEYATLITSSYSTSLRRLNLLWILNRNAPLSSIVGNLKLPHLESFSGGPFGTTPDVAVDQLTESLPALLALTITSSNTCRQPLCPALSLLTSIAKNCPNIGSINVVLNAKVVPSVPSLTKTSTSKLHSLRLGHSWLGDPAEVANFLRSVFPRLCGFQVFEKRPEDQCWLSIIKPL